MSKKVVAVFESHDQAETAVNRLREAGFDREISVVAKDKGKGGGGGAEMRNDSVGDGTVTGAVAGGAAGLAVGAGLLAIPGLGPILAVGPIAGALSGAAAGGIGGALIDLGIPEAESKRLEQEVKQGKTIVTVGCDEAKAQECQEILRNSDAKEVKVHA